MIYNKNRSFHFFLPSRETEIGGKQVFSKKNITALCTNSVMNQMVGGKKGRGQE